MMDGALYLDLSIPNEEVRSIYQNTILHWFEEKIESTDTNPIYSALESGVMFK